MRGPPFGKNREGLGFLFEASGGACVPCGFVVGKQGTGSCLSKVEAAEVETRGSRLVQRLRSSCQIRVVRIAIPIVAR